MTISSSTRKAGPFTGNGVTTAFPFAFKVFAAADILAVRAVLATGVETTLTLTTDYTVALNADQDANPGGTVNMVVAPSALQSLTITSAIALLQQVVLTNLGGFYPGVINAALDRLTIFSQQLQTQADRSLKLALSTPNGVVPTVTASANGVLVWDGTGQSIITTPVATLAASFVYNSATYAAAIATSLIPYSTTAQMNTAIAAYAQPLDADLTAIAALATQTFGRSLLTYSTAALTRTALGSGAMGDTLFAAVTAADARTATGQGLTKISTTTVSAGSASQWITLSGSYTRYRLVLENFVPATSAADMGMQLSTNSRAGTLGAGNYGYSGRTTDEASGGADVGAGPANLIVFARNMSNSASIGATSTVDIKQATAASKFRITFNSEYLYSPGVDGSYTGGGRANGTTAVTDILLIASSGNIGVSAQSATATLYAYE